MPPTDIAWGETPAQLSVAVSHYLFAASPAVVVATPEALDADQPATAIADTSLPVLVTPSSAADNVALAAEIARLGAQWVVGAGDGAVAAARQLIADSAGSSPTVVSTYDDVPPFETDAAPTGLAVLVSDTAAAAAVKGAGTDADDSAADDSAADDSAVDDSAASESAADGSGTGGSHTDSGPTTMAAGVAAARAMASHAGGSIQSIHGSDPRGDADVIDALAADPPTSVLAIGSGFTSATRLAARLATAETGVQLPGGGQRMFPGRTLVALYGHPGTSSLGVLGAQDLDASIKRAKKTAKQYTSLVTGPVIPAFEIIATVASGSAGSSGLYSLQSSVKTLKPWVAKATDAGLYVILDLQPGRAHLLDQAKVYRELLEMPSVGLALDPEWKLGPHELPLQQIGHVDAPEVNAVIDWLGALVAEHHLPQKLLVLHQFRLSMLQHESEIDTGNDNVQVLTHMDGQGTPSAKEATWQAVVNQAPNNVAFGWKNFYVMDHPMMTPAETMDRKPKPVMISYQ